MDKPANDKKRAAYSFLVLLGIVSLFSDLTHEGSRSIVGPYLLLLGASAATVGFVSGLGEFIGYAFRLATGYLSDRTKKYWLMTIIGYCINLIAIPALALAPGLGWVYACSLLVIERFGKAIRNPAKTTLVSFAAKEVGVGKGFALAEALDQIGAVLGPVMLFLVLTFKGKTERLEAYAMAFALLAVPAAIALAFLLLARKRYPRPQDFEPAAELAHTDGLRRPYWLYLVGICLLAAGFADFPLMAFHFSKNAILPDNLIPIVYAGAMGIDAVAALFFGRMYDKKGMGAIVISTILSACFAPLVFLSHQAWVAVLGVLVWGIGIGAQESILKAAVTTMVSKDRRGTAFGFFNAGFGAFWFLGSWLMGILYDRSLTGLVVFSLVAQVGAVPFFLGARSLLNKAAAKAAAAKAAGDTGMDARG